MYEQDEANVFAEPSVMSALVLPYLLQMADNYCKSAALAKRLSAWVEENTPLVLDGLAVCKELLSGSIICFQNEICVRCFICCCRFSVCAIFFSLGELLPWVSLLMHHRFHSTLCGLFTRAAFLLRLLKTSDVQHLCDPSSFCNSVQDICTRFSQNGVHFPSALTPAVAEDLSLWHN